MRNERVRNVPGPESAVTTGILELFLFLNAPSNGQKTVKNGQNGYAAYLPKLNICCYHNSREVATHKEPGEDEGRAQSQVREAGRL